MKLACPKCMSTNWISTRCIHGETRCLDCKHVVLDHHTDRSFEQLYKDFEQWLSEWNGDEPAPQEHMTFEDWIEGRK